MSIIIAVIIRDLGGNKEMIFASDGRVLEHGTNNVRREDFDKVRKIGLKTCLGYTGQSGELFEDVYNLIKVKVQNMYVKDLLFVATKLKATILETLKSQRHAEVEKQYGPLKHNFILGGYYNKKPRLNTLLSGNNYQIEKRELLHSDNVIVEISASTDEIQRKTNEICKERLGHPQSHDEIVLNIRYVISKMAEQTQDINNHIFVRRLSREFELESYIGYD